LFPGDLPENPDSIFEPLAHAKSESRNAAGNSATAAPSAAAQQRHEAADSTSEGSTANTGKDSHFDDLAFVRFRPPRLERTAEGLTLSLPHIRLDRTLQFLLGDRLL
jgi:hypothetical protein